MVTRHRLPVLAATVLVAAVLVIVGAAAREALGGGPVFTTVPAGAVPKCSDTLDASLPYRVRTPQGIPTGLTAARCEIAGSPGGTFARRTQFYSAQDGGWVSITIAPPGATVNLDHATSIRQIPVRNGKATLGVVPVATREFVAVFWNDSDVAIVINAMLSPSVTPDTVTRVAQAVQ